MAHPSKRKGNRFERELRETLRGELARLYERFGHRAECLPPEDGREVERHLPDAQPSSAAWEQRPGDPGTGSVGASRAA